LTIRNQVSRANAKQALPALNRKQKRVAADAVDGTSALEVSLSPTARMIQLFEGKIRHIRSIAVNLLLVAAIAVVVPILASELFGSRVTIEKIDVPESMEQIGLSGTVVANRLWDAWSDLTTNVAIAKKAQNVTPSSQRIEFSIPDSGISFESLIHHVRAFFGRSDIRIIGEMVCEAEPCARKTMALRLRVLDGKAHVIQLAAIGNEPEELYYRRAMSEVLLVTDPVRGILALRDNDQERAIAELRRLVRDRHVDSAWALTFAGILLTNRGDFAAARASLDQALALQPRLSIALISRAAAEAGEGELDRAMATIEQAIAIDPKDGRAFMRRAEIEERRGERAAAIKSYRTAATLLPNAPEPLFGQATMHYRSGAYAEARTAYSEAIEIDPNFADARTGLALLALLDINFAEMARQYGEVVRLRPDDADAYAQLAYALGAENRLAEAVEAHRQAVALAPQQASYEQGLGTALSRLGDHRAALQAFETAQRLDPELDGIWFEIGDTLRALDRQAEAHHAFQKYLTLEPDGTMADFAQTHLAQEAFP